MYKIPVRVYEMTKNLRSFVGNQQKTDQMVTILIVITLVTAVRRAFKKK